MSGFTNVILEEKEGKALCFRSGRMVYEESWLNGMYIASGVNASAFPAASNCRPKPSRLDKDLFIRPQAFRLEADGEALGWDWQWVSYECEETDGGCHAILTLKHETAPIQVEVHTRLDGTQVMERWLKIQSLSDRMQRVSHIAVISGGLQVVKGWTRYADEPEKLYRAGYMENCSWGHEGAFRWHDLPAAPYEVAGRYLRGRHRHPMVVLENRATGECFVMQLGFSGGYAFEFDLDADYSAPDAKLSYAVRADGPAPMINLAPGESYETPHVHLGILFGGLDDAVNEMHAHLRKSVLCHPADGKYAWVEVGVGPEFDMSRESTMEAIDNAAKVGVELFFIDAGWYVPPEKEDTDWWTRVGDWHYNKERYPNGLSEIRDYVYSKGMKFGLWMDVERLGPLSKAYQEHPEWLARTYEGEGEKGTVINMANDEAAAWVESEIARVIEENGCDMFRLDYNVGWPGATLTRMERNGAMENNALRYYDNVYAIYRRLRQRFPNVVFENCAGGGGRTDVGMVANFNHTWVTDWQKAPRSFAITNGMTIALPPERVDRLIGGQGSFMTGSLDFQMRLLMFVRPTVSIANPNGAQLNTDQLDFMRHCVDLYKDFIRPFLPESKVYHHTPECFVAEPRGMGVLETAAKDASRGMLGIFRLSASEQEEITVRLRGVSRSKKYLLTFDNSGETCEVSGYQLMNEGVHVRLTGALTSELVLYQEI